MRDPWKRDPDIEPVISKISCEYIKEVLHQRQSFNYGLYVRSLPLLPHSYTEANVPTPESSHPWTQSKNTERQIFCGVTYNHSNKITT